MPESASRGGGGVCSQGGCLLPGGVCSQGVSAPGGVCSGECLLWGVCLLLGGVSFSGGSVPGGVSAPGGMVSQHALRQTPPC